jgi:hypothetical protein
MSHDPYDDDPRRENLMQRRLRKARGEEIPDDLEDYGYDDYDADERPRALGGYAPPRRSPAYRPRSGGCSQMTLVLGLGFLSVLLVGLLMLNSMLGGIGQIFSGAPQLPDIREIIVTPTPQVITGAAVVQRVRQLSRLETASYTIQTVIEINQSQGNPIFDFFAGDALLLIAQGTVVAGVDLSVLTSDDVTVAPDGRTVTLRLPPAQIFTTTLDNEATRVYSRNRGWFAPENKDLESQARQQAEQQILLAACEDGVLSKASEQAEQAMRQFLGLLDGVEVVVVAGPQAPCAAP